MFTKALQITGLAVLLLAPMAAQAEFPERDVRVVMPWAAGGGTDAIVRKLTNIAEQSIGASMYVENIDGGVSTIGLGQVMSAKPDGYSIGVLVYDSVVTVPWQGLVPTYSLDRLKLIARVTSEPDAMIVDANSDYNSVDDLVAAAKAEPGKVRIGIQALGSRTHLAVLQLQDQAKVNFKIISYPEGAGQQKEAILSNEIDIAVTSLGDFAGLLGDGTARGLMEFSSSRNPTYPDVPTASEEGYDLQMGSFIVFGAPAGTPDDAIAKIEAAYKAALDSDEFQEWVSKVGVTPDWLGSDEVTVWADETSQRLFAEMDALVAAGILTK